MPTAQEMEASGFAPEDFEHEVFEVWPENWPSFQLFKYLETQWRIAGMGAYAGLDYNVMHHKMDRMNLSPEDYEAMEDDIQTMEMEAITVLNKKT